MPDITTLLVDIEDYLNITWKDAVTDSKITGYIKRGMARLQVIAGAQLDFIVEGLPRALLFDYCRYANSQALEVFEKNFESELLELNLSNQAPIIDRLIVVVSVDASDGIAVNVAPAADEGNSYVYCVGTSLTVPACLDICVPGAGYTAWHGDNILAASGEDIMIIEINSEYKAVRAGKATVTLS